VEDNVSKGVTKEVSAEVDSVDNVGADDVTNGVQIVDIVADVVTNMDANLDFLMDTISDGVFA